MMVLIYVGKRRWEEEGEEKSRETIVALEGRKIIYADLGVGKSYVMGKVNGWYDAGRECRLKIAGLKEAGNEYNYNIVNGKLLSHLDLKFIESEEVFEDVGKIGEASMKHLEDGLEGLLNQQK